MLNWPAMPAAVRGRRVEALENAIVIGASNRETEENRLLEVTYANGDKEILYFKDFNSGAMIENIVARAKMMAIKEFLETGQKGIRIAHLLAACVDEFSENEGLPNTTSLDDWARISGKKGVDQWGQTLWGAAVIRLWRWGAAPRPGAGLFRRVRCRG
jgi:hypothetical protein